MRKAFLSLLGLVLLSVRMAHAEDLVTRDGTVYHDYKVLSHDAGYVTIMYSDGGGKIPLSNLPDKLQKEFGYNKAQADAFVAASVAQDRQDRQSIANEEEQSQKQAAARAQAEALAEASAAAPGPPAASPASTAASPGSAYTSPTGGVIPPNLPPPPPNRSALSQPTPPAPNAGTASVATGGPSSPAPASEEDMDDLQQKIKDVKEEIVNLKEGMQGASPSDAGPYRTKLDADQTYLASLQGQLNTMQKSELPKKLTWDDIAAIHEQIVALLDDITVASHEAEGAGFVAQLRAADQKELDQDQIAEFRRQIKAAIKPPVTLSPEEVSALEAQISLLSTDIVTARERDMEKTPGNLGKILPPTHEENENNEKLAALGERLHAALRASGKQSTEGYAPAQ